MYWNREGCSWIISKVVWNASHVTPLARLHLQSRRCSFGEASRAPTNATTPIHPPQTAYTCRRRIQSTMQDPSQGVAAPLVCKVPSVCNCAPANTRPAKPPSFDLRPPVPTRRASRPQCRLQVPARCPSDCQNSCAHVMDIRERTQRWNHLA